MTILYRLILLILIDLIQLCSSRTTKRSFKLEDLLPTASPNPQLTKIQNYRDQLMDNLLKTYDRLKPSHTPVVIYTNMIIDHIRNFNEYDMTTELQATFVLNWMDKRAVWESKDYGNLTEITVTDYKIWRFWIPEIQLRAILPPKRTIIQPANTELLLTANGNMFAVVKISTKIACESRLDEYPYDTPNCSFYILCYNPVRPNNDVLFGNMHMFGDKNALFSGKNVSKNLHLHIMNLTSARYYITTDGIKLQTTEDPKYVERPVNGKKSGKTIVTIGTFMSYQFYFERNVVTYISCVLIPLYIGTLLMLFASSLNNKASLLLMIVTIFYQYMTMTRISLNLPPNYLITPFCMKYAAIIFMETILLLIYKVCYGYLVEKYEKDKKSLEILAFVSRCFGYFVISQLIVCTFILFIF